jgi:hypothetical protein
VRKKVDSAPRKSNVVPLHGKRVQKTSGRLDGAALAQALPRLTDSQRAAGIEAGANLDEMAIRAFLYVGPKPVRRSGEDDDGYALRVRDHAARGILRRLSFELEALRPTAEGASDAHRDELLRLLDALEGANARTLGHTKRKRAIIGAVRETLEYQRRARVTDLDAIRLYACDRAPELADVSNAGLQRAIDRWPGLPSKPVEWATVVLELLTSADKRIDRERGKKRPPAERLTDAKSYRAIAETWKSGNRTR